MNVVESVKCVSVMTSRSILCVFIISTNCLTLVALPMFSTLKYAIVIGVPYGRCIGCDLEVVCVSNSCDVMSCLNLVALGMCVGGCCLCCGVCGKYPMCFILRLDPAPPPPGGGGGPAGCGGLKNLLVISLVED